LYPTLKWGAPFFRLHLTRKRSPGPSSSCMSSLLFPPTHRVSIRSPYDADAPQLRVDLNAQHALGRILDRRAWWTASASERVRWLNDLDAFLVEKNLQQVMSAWHESLAIDWGYLTQSVLDAAAMAMHANAKRVAVDKIFTEMVDEIQASAYFGLQSDDSERMDEDDTSETGADIPSQYKRENLLGQVAWFVSLLVMRERLLALTPDEATPATVACLLDAGPTCGNATTLARATSLVLTQCARLRTLQDRFHRCYQTTSPLTRWRFCTFTLRQCDPT
jgi:hypothetical protein